MKTRIVLIPVIAALLAGCGGNRYRIAEEYVENREYNRAIRAYMKMIDPHIRNGKKYIMYDRETVTRLGVVYWHDQKYETAVKILDMVIGKDPHYGKALFYKGLSYEALGREDDAIDVYRSYTGVAPGDPYRKVMAARLDWAVRLQISRQIELALRQEDQLAAEDISPRTVAVLYFENASGDPRWQPIQKGLAEMMITDLSQVEELSVVERLRLSMIMEELNLSASSLAEQGFGPRVGRLVGAGTLIKGSYHIRDESRMSVDAGIFQYGDTKQPAVVDFDGNLSRIFRIEKELVLRIIDHFNIDLTPEQRERILDIPTEDLMAFMQYCNGLAALDAGDYSQAQRHFSEAVRRDGDFMEAKDKLMSTDIWQAAHSSNTIRVDRQISQLINTKVGGESRLVYRPTPELVSKWNRLQRMSANQNVRFIPGTETRKAVNDAETSGAAILPRVLELPPPPPGTGGE